MARILFIALERGAITKRDHHPKIEAPIHPRRGDGTAWPASTRSTPGIIRRERAARINCARSAGRPGCFNHIRTTWVTGRNGADKLLHELRKSEPQIANVVKAVRSLKLLFRCAIPLSSSKTFGQIGRGASLFGLDSTRLETRTKRLRKIRRVLPKELVATPKSVHESRSRHCQRPFIVKKFLAMDAK